MITIVTMSSENKEERHILIRITKVDHFLRFLNFVKEFSVNKFKGLYQKGKDLIKFFLDTKKILILSRFTFKDTLAFSDIQRDLNISSSLLSYDLNQMVKVGFLERIYQEERKEKKFSYYRLTGLGKKVLAQVVFSATE